MAKNNLTDHQMKSALLTVLRATTTLPAKVTLYASALGAMLLIAGNDPSGALTMFASGVGMNILANLLERVARGENPTETEIQEQVENAVRESSLDQKLADRDIQVMIARLFRRLDLLQFALQNADYEVFVHLSEQIEKYEFLSSELREYLWTLQMEIKQLATRKQGDEILARLDRLIDYIISNSKPKMSFLTQFEKFVNDLTEWFHAVGYSFEQAPIQSSENVEFLLNIPNRREGYDRVLVRAIEGEIKLKHIEDLRRKIQLVNADRSWIITQQRISQSVRKQERKLEQEHLFAYTFDELIEEQINLNTYFEWLRKEVEEQKINDYFVTLSARVHEFDNQGHKMDESYYSNVLKYLDQWLVAPEKEHISILGEFGTGKTWLTLYYAYQHILMYEECRRTRLPRPRIPLVIPLRNYAEGFRDIGSLLSEFLFRKHRFGLPGYEAFKQLNRMGRLLLIFDGFDEMALYADPQIIVNNFWEIAKVALLNSKVILTCRTEFFLFEQQSREVLGGERKPSTPSLVFETPRFEVLNLDLFSTSQVRRALRQRAGTEIAERVLTSDELLEMARRPILIELILESLTEIESEANLNLALVYYLAVVRKMERDIRTLRTFTSLADKLYFLCELSWEMYSTGQMKLNHKEFPEKIRSYFGLRVSNTEQDFWQYDLLGHSMLVRDIEGNYELAHRSLAEFFVAYKFAAEMGAIKEEFIQAARQQRFIDDSLSPRAYKWSEYFRRKADEGETVIPIAPLATFITETMGVLASGIGKQKVPPGLIEIQRIVPVLDLMVGMAEPKRLWDVLLMTRNQGESTGFVGGNVATLLRRMGESFAGADLSGCELTGAELYEYDLSNIDLRGCKWQNADLHDCRLENADLCDSDLTGLDLWKTGCTAVRWSPDGRYLASGWGDGQIVIFEISKQEYRTVAFLHHGPKIADIRWHPSGELLASCVRSLEFTRHSYDVIRIWDCTTWKEVISIPSFTGLPSNPEFDLGGNMTASHDTGDLVRASFDAKRDRLVAISDSGGLLVIDLRNGNKVNEVKFRSGLINLGISPDYRKVIVADRNGRITVLDAESLKILNQKRVGKNASGPLIRVTTKYIITPGEFLHIPIGKRKARRIAHATSPYPDILFLDGGEILVVGNFDHQIYLVQSRTLEVMQTIGIKETGIDQLGYGQSISFDEKYIFVGGLNIKSTEPGKDIVDYSIVLLDTSSKAYSGRFEINIGVQTLSCCPTSNVIATASSEVAALLDLDLTTKELRSSGAFNIPMNCNGAKLTGAQGLSRRALYFLYQCGAKLDESQLSVLSQEPELSEVEEDRRVDVKLKGAYISIGDAENEND